MLLMTSLVVLSTGLHGCQKQAQPGFELVEQGMTREQVRTILGAPSSTYDRESDSQGALLRLERWQYGDNLSTFTTGVFFSDLPSDSVWVVFFDEEGRVAGTREPDRSALQQSAGRPSMFEDPFDPAVPSRNR